MLRSSSSQVRGAFEGLTDAAAICVLRSARRTGVSTTRDRSAATRPMSDTAVHVRTTRTIRPGGRPPVRGAGPSADLTPVLLVRAAHPRQAVLTAARRWRSRPPSRAARRARSGWSLATVLVGQAVLGWDNDLVDRGRRPRGRAHATSRSPPAPSTAGTVGFALACAVLLARPAVALERHHRRPRATCSRSLVGAGSATAGCATARCRGCRGRSSFALYPAYLSYGGWGGGADGHPPTRRDDRGRRPARGRRPRPAPRCAAWSTTTGPAAGTSRCGSRCGSGHRGCWS